MPLSRTGGFPLVGHPGFAESLIPVWGSGREAIADFQEGHPVEGLVNTLLALSDLAPIGFAAKDIAKMGYKFGKSNTWGAVRKRLGANGFAEKNQPVHHVYIPNSARVPDFIKQFPLNLKALPSHEVHGRVHGRWKGLEKYDPITKWRVETPIWSKAAQGDVAGHAGVEWYKDRP